MQISYNKKLVKNLGNYESLALEIGIEDKIDFEIETYDEAFDRIRTIVNNKLKSELSKIGNKQNGK